MSFARFIGVAVATVVFLLPLGALADPVSAIDVVPVPSKFTPNKIVLHQGVTTKVEFVRTEGVHAIQSADLGIPLTTLAPGKDVAISVTPKKTGTFVLHCEVICGTDHDSMTLTIVVES